MPVDETKGCRPTGAANLGAAPQVWVSVVHWNGGQATIDCVESVLADGYPTTSIVLVDNGSTDGSTEAIVARWPAVHLLRNASNLGFTGGHNRAMAFARDAGADFVLLLNQDAVLLPGCIGRMVALTASDARIGLVSPVVYYDDDPSQIQFAGSVLQRDRLWLHHSHDVDAVRQYEIDDPAAMCLWGTALLVGRAVIDSVGLLDDRFFAYFEDSDYSVRAASMGWHKRMCFDAGILHRGHRSSRTRPPHFFYLMTRNEMLFWRKTLGFASCLRLRRVLVARALRESAKLRDAGMFPHAEAILDGVWDGLMHRHGPFDSARRAPAWFGRVARVKPYLLALLLEGEVGPVLRESMLRIRGA